MYKFLFLFLAVTSYGQTCLNIPNPVVANTEKVCHTAYISQYDSKLKVPMLVSYELTGAHSLGCVVRVNEFHKELDSAAPIVYDRTGYDLGHFSPYEDNAYDNNVAHESFSMINISPQRPLLNRSEWERLEETIRSWALLRGNLLIYIGSVVTPNDKKINGVDVPIAFFKIIVDESTGDVLAFQMPQQAIPKGDLTPWLTTVAKISQETGIVFNLKESGTVVWPSDIEAWHVAHKKACEK